MISVPILLAICGYFLSFVGYAARVYEQMPKLPIVIGMIIVTLGYLALLASKVLIVSDSKYRVNAKENPDVGVPLFHTNKNRGAEWLMFAGNALLAIFFVSIFLLPELTMHVRWYDIFAAFGYSSAIAPVPAIIPLTSLVIYYFFGAVTKSWSESWIDKTQIVSRLMLAIFYALSAAKFY